MKLLEQEAGSDVVEEFGDRIYRLIGDVIASLNFQSDTILSETVLEFLKKRSLYLLSDEKKNYIKVFFDTAGGTENDSSIRISFLEDDFRRDLTAAALERFGG